MNEYSEPGDNIEECFCEACKSLFWVPYYDDLPDIGHPKFCPFCGLSFDLIEEFE